MSPSSHASGGVLVCVGAQLTLWCACSVLFCEVSVPDTAVLWLWSGGAAVLAVSLLGLRCTRDQHKHAPARTTLLLCAATGGICALVAACASLYQSEALWVGSGLVIMSYAALVTWFMAQGYCCTGGLTAVAVVGQQKAAPAVTATRRLVLCAILYNAAGVCLVGASAVAVLNERQWDWHYLFNIMGALSLSSYITGFLTWNYFIHDSIHIIMSGTNGSILKPSTATVGITDSAAAAAQQCWWELSAKMLLMPLTIAEEACLLCSEAEEAFTSAEEEGFF